MRVTNNLMANALVDQLQRKTEQLIGIQGTIASGKEITKPSDDPVQMGNVLDCRKTIASTEQYGRNIEWGTSWLNTTEATLGSIDTLLINTKELAVYQATETATDATREMAAQEVGNLYDQMMQLANTSLGGRYIFAGYRTDVTPFTRDGDYTIAFAGDQGEIDVIIGDGVEMTVNTNGAAVFNGDVDVFDVMKQLKEGLENNDTEAIATQIDRLGEAMKQVLNERAQVGARLNRLEASQNHWRVFQQNTREMLFDIEEADLVTAMTELQSMEVAYEAALSATATIIQPNLMQFLR